MLLDRSLSRGFGADIDSWADVFKTRMAVGSCRHVRTDSVRDGDLRSESFARCRPFVRPAVIDSGSDAVVGRAGVIQANDR